MKKLILALFLILLFSGTSFAASLPSYKINELLKAQGRFIRFIGDERYITPTVKSMNNRLKKIVENKYIDSTLLDCDDISLIIHAEIKKQRYNNNTKLPLAFGEAVIQDIGEKHALNFFISNDKIIYLFDPYTFKIYPLNDKVKLLFIRM